MSPVVLAHQVCQLRLAATLAHVIPSIAIDLVASDGRVLRVGSSSEARPDMRTCQFRALVARLRADPTPAVMADLLEMTPGATIDVEVHLGCRHVRDLRGGVYLLQGKDRTRLVFVTLLDGPRAREVAGAVERPASPSACSALAALTTIAPVEVMHDELTAVTVVYCDQHHPAGLPLLEAYGQALLAACTVAELLDELP